MVVRKTKLNNNIDVGEGDKKVIKDFRTQHALDTVISR